MYKIYFFVVILFFNGFVYGQDLGSILFKTYTKYRSSASISLKFLKNEVNYYSSDTLKSSGEISFIQNKAKSHVDYLLFKSSTSNDNPNFINVLYANDTLKFHTFLSGGFKLEYKKKLLINRYHWYYDLPDFVRDDYYLLRSHNFKSKLIENYTINKVKYLNYNVFDVVVYYKTNASDDIGHNIQRFIIDTSSYAIYYYSESYKINNYDLLSFKDYYFTDVLFNDSSNYAQLEKDAEFGVQATNPVSQERNQLDSSIDVLHYPLLYQLDSIITLSQLKGKIVILDFWYASCFYCLKQFPDIVNIVEQYQNRDDIVFLGVNHVDNEVVRRRIEDKMHLNFATYVTTDKFNQLFNVNSHPSLIILGRDQNIVYRHSGYDDKNYAGKLKKVIDGLLK